MSESKEFLFFGGNMHGIINLTIGLAQELKCRGHSIEYFVGQDYVEYAENYGIDCKGMLYPEYPYPLHTYTVFIQSVHASYIFLEKKSEYIKSLDIDCIITTFDDIIGVILHRILDVPIIIVNPFPNTKDFWNSFWKTNSLSSLGIKKEKWIRNDVPKHYQDLRTLIRRNYGVSLPSSVTDAHYFKNIKFDEGRKLDLILNPEKFVQPFNNGRGNESQKFVGSFSRTNREQNGFSDADIYVCLGTTPPGFDRTFLEKTKVALSNLDAQILYSFGGYRMPVASVPDNFQFVSFAPQQQLLPSVDVFVTHGGMNSVHELIGNQVPALVTPHSYDQFITARCLEEADAALVSDADSISSESMHHNVKRLLHSPDIAVPGLPNLKRRFEEAGGRKRAADLALQHAT